MNQYLYDDDSIIALFNSETKPTQSKTLFSRYEEYALYLGLDREITRPSSYNNYAKIYIRADLKKTEIKRAYQKITEFYADASSILIGLYEFLIIIISIINNAFAENSFIKKLFIFKGIKDKHFNMQNKYPKIKELLSLNEKNFKIFFPKDNNILEKDKISAKNNIYDFYIKSPSSNRSQESKLFLTEERKNKIVINPRNNINKNSEFNKIKTNIHAINIVNENKLKNFGKENKENILIKNKQVNKNINYNFSLSEIIFSLLCSCLVSGNLKIKNEYNEKATQFLYNKLDIILYIRNMILFDIINETILDDDKKHIINFLSRQVLDLDKEENKDIFYQNYYEKDFDDFFVSYLNLARLDDKINREKRLMILSKRKLEEYI